MEGQDCCGDKEGATAFMLRMADGTVVAVIPLKITFLHIIHCGEALTGKATHHHVPGIQLGC